MQVVVARLRDAGMNIDDVTLDVGTAIQRRTGKEPLDKGGWSMFALNVDGTAHFDPLIALGLRTGPAAWVGWPQNTRMEELRDAWIDTDDGKK